MNRKQKMMVAKDHLLSFLDDRYGIGSENEGDIYDARKSEDDWDGAIEAVLGNVKERGRKYFQYTPK